MENKETCKIEEHKVLSKIKSITIYNQTQHSNIEIDDIQKFEIKSGTIRITSPIIISNILKGSDSYSFKILGVAINILNKIAFDCEKLYAYYNLRDVNVLSNDGQDYYFEYVFEQNCLYHESCWEFKQ